MNKKQATLCLVTSIACFVAAGFIAYELLSVVGVVEWATK